MGVCVRPCRCVCVQWVWSQVWIEGLRLAGAPVSPFSFNQKRKTRRKKSLTGMEGSEAHTLVHVCVFVCVAPKADAHTSLVYSFI